MLWSGDFCNGKYIIVGAEGAIWTSENLSAWTFSEVDQQDWYYGTGCGNGTFYVASGGGKILMSTDGLNWTVKDVQQMVNRGRLFLYDVAFGNGTLVAVGQQGIVVSDDGGNTWQAVWYDNEVPIPMIEEVYYDSAEQRFFAVGYGGLFMTSQDGHTWDTLPVDPNWPFWIKDFYSDGHGRFVVVGSGGAIYTASTNLSDLTLSAGSLTPAFDADTTEYTVDVSFTNSIDITATLDDTNADLAINGTPQDSGSPRTVALNPGENTIDVTVTSQAGTTKRYTVLVRAFNGSGILTASTSRVTAGSSGHTLVFTYTAQTDMQDGAVAIDVPEGWSLPSTTAGDPGYTTASTGSVEVSNRTITVTGLTLAAGETVTIAYGDRSGGGPGAAAPTTAGAQTWQARSRVTGNGTLEALGGGSPTIKVEPEAAARLTFATQPGGGTGGLAWSSQPVVVVQDVYGNTVDAAADDITLTITGGTGADGATLRCDANPVRAVRGVASFSGCRIDKAGTGYTLTAASGTLTSAVSDPFDVAVGAPVGFKLTPSAQQTVSDQPLDLTVTVIDAGGNTVTGYTGTVLLTSNDPIVWFEPTSWYTFQAADNGEKTFQVFFRTAGDQTVTAFRDLSEQGKAMTGTSEPVRVLPGEAYMTEFVVQPGGGTGGLAWSSQPVVAVVDRYQNTVTSATYAVTLGILPGTGAAGAVLTCDANPVQAVDGVARFSGCRIDKAGTGYKLIARAAEPSLEISHSAFFEIATGPAAAFTVTASAQETVAGEPLDVTVTAKDAGGNTVTGYEGTVRFGSSDSRAVLPAEYAFEAGYGGTGTFQVTLRTAGEQTVTVTDAADAGIAGTSGPIAVRPAAPAAVTVTAHPASVVADGATRSTVTARVTDAYGNDAADGTPVTFAVTGATAALTRTEGATAGGVVTTEVYAAAAGTVTVTAAVYGTSVSGSVSVTFTPRFTGGSGASSPTATPGTTTSGDINPTAGGTVQNAAGTLRLEIPVGAIEGVSGGPVRISVTDITGAEAKKLLQTAKAPEGVRAIGRVFEFKAETGGGTTVTRFGKPVTFTVALSPADLAGVTDPEKIGLFRLNEDGTLTFVGGRLVDGKLVVQLYGFSRYLLAEVHVAFPDLAGHWARDDVERMASKYIVKGLPDGRFHPEGRVTRAEFAAMLVRALGLPPGGAAATGGASGSAAEGGSGASFSDVRPGDWFYGELAAAVRAGLIQGYGDGTFRPDAPVTREQMAVLVARALAAGKAGTLSAGEAERRLAGFADRGEVSPWAREGLALAVREGIVNGRTAATIAPQEGATRQEAAVMVARFWRK